MQVSQTSDYALHTLQATMEMQKSLGALGAKLERLIDDVSGLDTKVDDLRHKVSFVKGILWVIGAIIASVGLAVTFSDKLDITIS